MISGLETTTNIVITRMFTAQYPDNVVKGLERLLEDKRQHQIIIR